MSNAPHVHQLAETVFEISMSVDLERAEQVYGEDDPRTKVREKVVQVAELLDRDVDFLVNCDWYLATDAAADAINEGLDAAAAYQRALDAGRIP